jgi:hypothetical protein
MSFCFIKNSLSIQTQQRNPNGKRSGEKGSGGVAEIGEE